MVRSSEREAASWLLKNVPVHIEGNTLFPDMHATLIALLDKAKEDTATETAVLCADAVSKCLVDRRWDIKSDKHLREACLNVVNMSQAEKFFAASPKHFIEKPR